MKRILDILCSFFGLVITSPFLVIIAVLIKIEDGGPVFYRAHRTGKHGIPFRMFKFRTMIVNADLHGPASTSKSDQRITRTGKFLREHKLDELPQLINVFLSQMSMVGPRPEVKKFTDMLSGEENKILTVKPGITDWASILNSDEGSILEGSMDPDKTYMELIRPEKIRLQLEYVNNNNFFIDLKIIFLTILKVVSREKII